LWQRGGLYPEQPQSEPFFQAADGVAQRRLRHAELRGSFREAALSPDSQESQDIVQICAVHL
jgi:hypothetical protein